MPPNRITHDKIHNFLERKTIPLTLSALPADQRECPICMVPYSEVDTYYVHPMISSDAPEWAVQVTDCDECEHIFGRRCLENSIKAGGPWSHTCPLCRKEWLVPPHSARTEILHRVRRAAEVLGPISRDTVGLQIALEAVEELLREIENRLLERRYI